MPAHFLAFKVSLGGVVEPAEFDGTRHMRKRRRRRKEDAFLLESRKKEVQRKHMVRAFKVAKS